MYKSVLGGLNLGLHEFGHLIFSPFPEFLSKAGGTIVQLLAPIYGIYNFSKQKDYFALALCFGWLSTNCYDVATYAADARSMSLTLVSPFGGHINHDWNYMLSQLGLLDWDKRIAFFFRAGGFLSMSICLCAGTWMVWLMLKGDNIKTIKKEEAKEQPMIYLKKENKREPAMIDRVDPGPRKVISKLAIASLIFGLIGLWGIGIIFPILLGIPAVICGHKARSKIKRAGGALRGKGLALAGLIIGYIHISLIIVFIVFLSLHARGNSPALNYKKFFTPDIEKEFTVMAEKILKDPDAAPSTDIVDQLKQYKLSVYRNIFSYPSENIVVFAHGRRPNYIEYIYAKEGLNEIYSAPSVITEKDIHGNWGQFVKIVKTENDPSKVDHATITFVPEIAYPFLKEHLDKTLLDKLKGLPLWLTKNREQRDAYDDLISGMLDQSDKNTILEVLNAHRLLSSKLIENKHIRYIKDPAGHSLSFRDGFVKEYNERLRIGWIGTTNRMDGYGEIRHVTELIEKRILRIIDDEGHLEIKSDLSHEEILDIEWLHFEIMRTVYSGVVSKKQDYSNGKIQLSDRWYFYFR